jgi:hypothetical protein
MKSNNKYENYHGIDKLKFYEINSDLKLNIFENQQFLYSELDCME